MKTIKTDGISYIKLVPGASSEWYYGSGFEQGDLYEAETMFKDGIRIKGRKFCLVHYPDGTVYHPVPEADGKYCGECVFENDGIYILNVDFYKSIIQIIRFDCADHTADVHVEIPLSEVKDCYNLRLEVSPLTLTRQCVGDNEFEIVWPEKVKLKMDDHDSFFLRDNDRLFFSRWHEEGDGADYRYWVDTVVKDLNGEVQEILKGDVMLMPNGEIWNLE